MSLQERLVEDLKEAMKSGDELRRSTIRLVRAAIQNEEIATRKEIDESGISTILARMVRQHQESIYEFRRGDRVELAQREEAELDIIREYMPKQLSREEIEKLVHKAIDNLGASDASNHGKIMGLIMPQIKGRATGSDVKQVVTDLLGE